MITECKHPCTEAAPIDGGRYIFWERCVDCREYIPLGPSEDSPEVLIEIRAAELSCLATSHATSSESQGWIDCGKDRDCANVPRDQWDAGWLGRIIHEHGRSIPSVGKEDPSAPPSAASGESNYQAP